MQTNCCEDFILDREALRGFLSGGDNSRQILKAKKIIKTAIAKDLTPLQRDMVIEHYFKGRTMTEIACSRGINKASVSKVLSRARKRLEKVIKYSI